MIKIKKFIVLYYQLIILIYMKKIEIRPLWQLLSKPLTKQQQQVQFNEFIKKISSQHNEQSFQLIRLINLLNLLTWQYNFYQLFNYEQINPQLILIITALIFITLVKFRWHTFAQVSQICIMIIFNSILVPLFQNLFNNICQNLKFGIILILCVIYIATRKLQKHQQIEVSEWVAVIIIIIYTSNIRCIFKSLIFCNISIIIFIWIQLNQENNFVTIGLHIIAFIINSDIIFLMIYLSCIILVLLGYVNQKRVAKHKLKYSKYWDLPNVTQYH